MNPVKTIKYYLNSDRTWFLENDGTGDREIWLRTEKGYHLIDLEMLKKMHLAAGELIKEIEECANPKKS